MFLQCLACTCKVAVSVGVRQVLWRLWSAFSTLSWLSQLEPGYHKPTQKICVVCIESIIQTCALPRQYLGVSMSPVGKATCRNNQFNVMHIHCPQLGRNSCAASMYEPMHICIFVCICICVWTCTYIHICICVCLYTYIRVCLHAYTCVRIHIYTRNL